MFDWTDQDSVFAFRELVDAARDAKRPICFWVGAGASAWCGYPTWSGLAETLDREFSRLSGRYDRTKAKQLFKQADFPSIFSLCRAADISKYNTIMVRELGLRAPSAVFLRFIAAIRTLQPTHIITTNVDEMLEKHVASASTIFRSDIERLPRSLIDGASFVAKIHGAIGAISSLVFTREEYDDLSADQSFLAALRQAFESATVIFVGYSIRDEYVLRLLERCAIDAPLFGNGPHFALADQSTSYLPPNVRRIRYPSDVHVDHRASIQVIEELSRNRGISLPETKVVRPPAMTSSHFLMEIYPDGYRSTSVNLDITNSAGATRQVVVGDGFIDQEIPDNRSSVMHDVAVGLLCFEKIYTSVWAAQTLHLLLGSELFWHLIESGSLRLIHWQSETGMLFPSADAPTGGGLVDFFTKHPDGSPKAPAEILRKQIAPAPGREAEGERKLSSLEKSLIELDDAVLLQVPTTTANLLLRPSVRRALSMSEATSLTSIARWQTFPVLRLASLVRMAATCTHLGIPSARINYGAAALAGPAFSVATGAEVADAAAGYVVAGNFATDLGTLAQQDPTVLRGIVAFRDTAAGARLRQEILERLAVSPGKETALAINGGLQQAVRLQTLQAARDQMTKLYIQESAVVSRPPAFWNDVSQSTKALTLWRLRSHRDLREFCQKAGIQDYDLCPCGSGEKLKFCCLQATRTT